MELIKLLQIISDAFQWKTQRNKDFFEAIVAPLFVNAEAVYNDYVRIFDKVIMMLEDEETGLSQAKNFLIQERRINQSMRIKIRETIYVLRKRHSFSNVSFERGLEGILCAGVSQSEPNEHIDMAGFYKKNHTILGFLSELSQNEVPANMLPQFCRAQATKQLDALQSAFETLTAGYLELQTGSG